MSSTRYRFLYPRSMSQSGQRSESCFSNNSKSTEANLTKLYRKIELNEKVCHVQELGSTPKVKVTIKSSHSLIAPKIKV